MTTAYKICKPIPKSSKLKHFPFIVQDCEYELKNSQSMLHVFSFRVVKIEPKQEWMDISGEGYNKQVFIELDRITGYKGRHQIRPLSDKEIIIRIWKQ